MKMTNLNTYDIIDTNLKHKTKEKLYIIFNVYILVEYLHVTLKQLKCYVHNDTHI